MIYFILRLILFINLRISLLIIGYWVHPIISTNSTLAYPATISPVKDVTISPGENFTMGCSIPMAICKKFPHQPIIHFTRKTTKGISDIPSDSHVSREGCGVIVTLTNVTLEHGGRYFCVDRELHHSKRLHESLLAKDGIDVSIAYPPQIGPAHCISSNHADLNCSFCPHNYENAPTIWNWQITFTVDGNTHECVRPNKCTCYVCGGSSKKNGCQGKYSQFIRDANYIFNIVAGTESRNISVIANQRLVKPDRVDIGVENKTSDSVTIWWLHPMWYSLKNLTFWISYHVENTSGMVQMIKLDNPNKRHLQYKITGLQPYRRYNINVWSQPNTAGYKSDVGSITVTTEAAAPGVCPIMYSGAFRSLHLPRTDLRSVSIYWQAISNDDSNGPLLGYYVLLDDVIATTTNQNSVRLTQLLLDQVYNVTVIGFNAAGNSSDCHPVSIPKHNSGLHERSPKMVEGESEEEKNLLTFIWSTPPAGPPVNYTLMGCSMNSSSHNTCQDKTYFAIFPGGATNYSLHIRQDTHYVYAMAANYEEGSSGFPPSWICIRRSKAVPEKPRFQLECSKKQECEMKIIRMGCNYEYGRTEWYNFTLTNMNDNSLVKMEVLPRDLDRLFVHDMDRAAAYQFTLQAVGPGGLSAVQRQALEELPPNLLRFLSILVILLFVPFVYNGYRRIQKRWEEEQPRWEYPPETIGKTSSLPSIYGEIDEKAFLEHAHLIASQNPKSPSIQSSEGYQRAELKGMDSASTDSRESMQQSTLNQSDENQGELHDAKRCSTSTEGDYSSVARFQNRSPSKRESWGKEENSNKDESNDQRSVISELSGEDTSRSTPTLKETLVRDLSVTYINKESLGMEFPDNKPTFINLHLTLLPKGQDEQNFIYVHQDSLETNPDISMTDSVGFLNCSGESESDGYSPAFMKCQLSRTVSHQKLRTSED